jgi:AbrB family looped-hinge helix DNA binding protein
MKVRLVIDAAGGIRLPRTLRRALGVQEGDRLIAETKDDGLILRPAKGSSSVELYTRARVREFDEAERALAAALGSRPPGAEQDGAP